MLLPGTGRDIGYWLERETFPWKTEGYGGGKAGYEAWAGADYPGINKYLKDYQAIPVDKPAYPSGSVAPLPPISQTTQQPAPEYKDLGYWLEREQFPWKEAGYGGGKVGYEAWRTAGFPGIEGARATAGEPVVKTIPGATTGITEGGGSGPKVPIDEMLRRFGYTGPIGTNYYQEEALRLLSELSERRQPMETMYPAEVLYNALIGGEFAPDISGYTDPAKAFYSDILAGERGPDISRFTDPAAAAYAKLLSGEGAPDVSRFVDPAMDLYGDVISGAYGPEAERYKTDVYGATKTGALQNLGEIQDLMGERFGHRGGYFGGRHAISQAELARGTTSDLSTLLANLNYSGYQQDVSNRLSAAAGIPTLGNLSLGARGQDIGTQLAAAAGQTQLGGMGLQEWGQDIGTQLSAAAGMPVLGSLGLQSLGQDVSQRLGAAGGLQGIAGGQQSYLGTLLSSLMGGGEMLTSLDLMNRAELQNAQQRAYNDWLRARQEQFMPFQWGLNLLGFQPEQSVVTQGQASPWGSLLGSLIQAGGRMGSAAILA